METAHISIGSNRGDSRELCLWAVEELAGAPGVRMDAVSSLYLTEPVGFEDSQWFVNLAVRVLTDLSPDEILKRLHAIENRAGRVRDPGDRYGPRTLDLDLLFYGGLVSRSNGLSIPHPRLQERRFVLAPLCDISPDLVHPVLKKDMRSLLNALSDDPGKVVLHP